MVFAELMVQTAVAPPRVCVFILGAMIAHATPGEAVNQPSTAHTLHTPSTT